jgi:protein-S-isoprenylcysteine O-methyltransferase Ste14
MEGAASQVLPSVHHLRFLIFDWSLPNVIMGVIIVLVFFAAAWARLPRWIERGRDRDDAKGRKK